ncbi:MAG: hypothetical protein ACREQJ_13915 [Candidatus Binatia bacterium]
MLAVSVMRFVVLGIVGVTVFIMVRAIRSGLSAQRYHQRSGEPPHQPGGDGPVEISLGDDGSGSDGGDGNGE